MLILDDAITASDIAQNRIPQRDLLLLKLERVIAAFEVTTGRNILDVIAGGQELAILIQAQPVLDLITIETTLTDAA